MKTLRNLIPDPSTSRVWRPRPAAIERTDFTGGPAGAGVISGRLIVGDIEYGMVASTTTPGFDEPYAYDHGNGTFLTVDGITSANVPVTPPASGEWTPPILAQVAGRIIVTHPGFPDTDLAFGWFDVTEAMIGSLGDTVTGTRYITGNPNILGVQVGMTATGTGIPGGTTVLNTHPYYLGFDFVGDTHSSNLIDGIADTTSIKAHLFIAGPGIVSGTRVLAVHPNSIDISQATTSTVANAVIQCFGNNVLQMSPVADAFGDTHTNTTIDGIFPVDAGGLPLGVAVGQGVSGSGILPLTTITAVGPGNQITISQAATSTITGVFLAFEGATVVLSANTTATNDGIAFTIAGGTRTAPLWGAGNTDNFPLPSVPVGVAQMNGRAWFALGINGIVFSDSGFPCSVSNTLGVQALTTGDGLAVTAIAPLLLSAPITGGIVQAIVAFEEDIKMQQIIGDPVTANLSMNVMPVATGTHAPLSIVPCELGLAFVSPLGLRVIRRDGTVSQPIGDDGQGLTQPFQFAVVPSRICAAANVGVIRITVQNGSKEGDPFEEYWFDLDDQVWHGPHFPARLIQSWRTSFVIAPVDIPASLWQSDGYATPTSTYVENGAQMTWTAETALLPDNAAMSMNAMVESSVMFGFEPPLAIEVMALDEDRVMLGAAFAQSTTAAMRQQSLNWPYPIQFKQISLLTKGQSDTTLRLGNLYLRYQQLGYMLGNPQEADVLTDEFDGPIVDENGDPIEAS